MKKSDVIYDDNVDYDALEQHTYCLLYTSDAADE